MMSDTGLRMKKIIQTVEDHISGTGKLPSTTDIINAVDYSSNSIRDDLSNLVSQGELKVVYDTPKNPTIYMPEYMYQAVIRKQRVPEWAESYNFKRTKEIEESMSENEKELSKLRKLESLLFASGRILEEAVETACNLLELEDFNAPYEDSDMWDISFSLGGEIFVSDVKGKSSWADKTDVGQLTQWLQKYIDENPRKDPSDVSGLLIINHFKDIEPNGRWPKNLENAPLSDAADRYLRLGKMKFLTTISLFEIAKSIIEGSVSAENGRENLKNSMKEAL